MVTKLRRRRVANAKRAFTTRRVPARHMQTLVRANGKPAAGNLVLASVCELGKHRRIEMPNGRRALILPGDEIIVCYGNRYAPDQYEALIGDDLGCCDLVASGGIAACEINRHERMLAPTKITPLGLIGDDQGRPLNLLNYRIAGEGSPAATPPRVIVVAGTAMNSGKTFTAASVVRGLVASGLRVAGIKATGTGSGADLWKMKDLGADVVLDFTDAGFASTYKAPDHEVEAGVVSLINHAAERRCDFAVVEIADGLQHTETATLLRSSVLKKLTSGCVFAAFDSIGARAGYRELCHLGYRVLAVSGQLTRSPLAMREARASGCPVYTPFDIQAGALVPMMTDGARGAPGHAQGPAAPAAAVAGSGGQRDLIRFRDVEDAHALDFPDDLEESACNFG